MIAPIWKKINEKKKSQTVQGSGLINYTENPIQYKAGNNNFHNEKISIVNFVLLYNCTILYLLS